MAGAYLTRARRDAVKAQCRAKGLSAKAVKGWLEQAAGVARELRCNGIDDAEIAEMFRAVVGDVEADGPLMRASERSDGAEALARLAAGADAHARDNIGRTALHWAVFDGVMREHEAAVPGCSRRAPIRPSATLTVARRRIWGRLRSTMRPGYGITRTGGWSLFAGTRRSRDSAPRNLLPGSRAV